jgi:hypothetical protein
MIMLRLLAIVCAGLIVAGCAESYQSMKSPQAPAFAGRADGDERGDEADTTFSSRDIGPARGHDLKLRDGFRNKDSAGGVDQKEPSESIARKIIYNANVHLIVENFEEGEKKLREFIDQHQGRIASSDTQGTTGAQRSGRWKVRIPVEKFDAFKSAVEKIGNLERSSIDSKDVTEEFYDVQARIKNKQVEEKRLIDHLEKTTGKLSDILEVEKELSRVRGEIEQMQGRLNLLTNLTSLTTVDVFLREVKNYVPPTAPTFGVEAERTLSASWNNFTRTGKHLTLNLISVVPWLPVWVFVGLVLYVPLRRLWRQVKERSIVVGNKSEPTPQAV